MSEDSGVLDERRQTAASNAASQSNYSLVEVAQKTGISMPILLRYKREHPDRVPSVGSGSQQRFPEEAVDVLQEIHREETERQEEPRARGEPHQTSPGAQGRSFSPAASVAAAGRRTSTS